MERIYDMTGFVRNVNVLGKWHQLEISQEERARLQTGLLAEQAAVYDQAWDAAEKVMKTRMTRPSDRMIHDLAMQMTERTAPHIHMVYQNHLDKKARQLREDATEDVAKKAESIQAEANASAPFYC